MSHPDRDGIWANVQKLGHFLETMLHEYVKLQSDGWSCGTYPQFLY